MIQSEGRKASAPFCTKGIQQAYCEFIHVMVSLSLQYRLTPGRDCYQACLQPRHMHEQHMCALGQQHLEQGWYACRQPDTCRSSKGLRQGSKAK